MNVLKLLPQLSAIRTITTAVEKQLSQKFGFDAHLEVKECSAQLVFDAFVSIVSDTLTMPPHYILGKSRERPIVDARHISIYLIKTNTAYRLKEISSYFGRDHTTVIDSVRKVKNLNDAAFTEKLQACQDELKRRSEN